MQNLIELINKSELLKADDIDRLALIQDELLDTFQKSQIFRTRTEMEVSVLNDIKHPTPDSKYWQSVREQNVMLNETIRLSFDYKKKCLELKKAERDLDKIEDEIDKEIAEVDIEQIKFEIKGMERTASDRIREILEWSDIKKKHKKNMVTDGSNPNDHQLVSYTQRWIKQAQAIGNGGTQGERQNLFGQLRSGLKECQERGLLSKLEGITDEDYKLLTE
jgi:hypothetical protein